MQNSFGGLTYAACWFQASTLAIEALAPPDMGTLSYQGVFVVVLKGISKGLLMISI